jgi:hypothetical protein
MRLSATHLDELFANSRLLKNLECQIACAYCHAPMVHGDGPQVCFACHYTNRVFLSCADALDLIDSLRGERGVLIAPSTYVPGLGWVVAYYRSTRRLVA